MSRVATLEREVEDLSEAELAEFRNWFAEYDGEAWDRQFEADVAAGKLDRLAERALAQHARRETTKL